MGVIADFGATLWKMFAGDLPLSAGALASVAVMAALLAARAVPAAAVPFLLAAMIFGVFVTAINLSVIREFRKRSKR